MAAVRAQSSSCAVLVDNCYGEFTELREPPMVRAAGGSDVKAVETCRMKSAACSCQVAASLSSG